jgi:hypothetical protein
MILTATRAAAVEAVGPTSAKMPADTHTLAGVTADRGETEDASGVPERARRPEADDTGPKAGVRGRPETASETKAGAEPVVTPGSLSQTIGYVALIALALAVLHTTWQHTRRQGDENTNGQHTTEAREERQQRRGEGAGTTTEAQPEVMTTLAEPEPPVQPNCPPDGGANEPVRVFTDPPPMCIGPSARYVAEVTTNYGTFQLALNNSRAPWTVNNFVFLARWRFYEGTQLIDTSPAEHVADDPTAVVLGESVAVDDPVAREDMDQVPGYSLQFDWGADTYPDGGVELSQVPVVVYDAYHPHRWEIMIANRAVELVDENRDSYPLLGELRCGLGVFGDPQMTDPSAMVSEGRPIVIESVEIHELPADGELEIRPRRDCVGSNQDQQAGYVLGAEPCCALPDN